MNGRSQDLRVALDLARRLGLVDADRLKRVRERLDAEPVDPEPSSLIAVWLGLPDVLFDVLLILARTLPADVSDSVLREKFRLQARADDTRTPTLGEDGSSNGSSTLVMKQETRRPGVPEQPSIPALDDSASSGSGSSPTNAPATLRANVPPVLGPYVLEEELGHGGMGVVFRAHHQKMGTPCAIKVLIAGEHASPEAIARFQREAAAVARMGKHPNIVNVFDLGQAGSLLYYAMELIQGTTLSKRMKTKDFSPMEAAALTEKVARALHFAHEHGVIHRDVKPDNIVVREDGEPQVMDFGLARDLASADRISVTGEVMGTLAYMSPEQARGEVEDTDARTDVYALGGVLYEMLTGFPPHPGRTAAAILPLILAGDVVAPRRLRPEMPRDLETICLKCLALEPGKRYASAQALAEDLARCRNGEPIVARPVGRIGRTVRRVRRHPLVSGLVALVVLLATALAWRFLGPVRLSVEVRPANARITVNGKPLGTRGGWVWPAGSLFIRAVAPGYEPFENTYDVAPGRKELPIITLEPRKGALSVTGGLPGCSVTLRDVSTRAEVARLHPPVAGVLLPPATYLLEAHLADFWDSDRQVTIAPGGALSVHVSLGRRVLWRWATEAPLATPVALGDLDGDGSLDFVFVTADDAGATVHAVSGELRQTIWEESIAGKRFSPCRLVDLNGDAVLDCVVAASELGEAEASLATGKVYALSGRDGSILWEGPSDQILVISPGDLDGDGLPDCVVSPDEKRVSAISSAGQRLWRNEELGDHVLVSPELRDLDGDGSMDCFVASNDHNLYAMSGKNTKLWAKRVRPLATTPPVLGDLDGDGDVDVVAGFDDRVIRAISGKNHEFMWPSEAKLPGVTALPPTLGLDGKGVVDTVVVVSGEIAYAVSARDGKERWKRSLGKPIVSRPAAGDLDGDGRSEYVVRLRDGGVVALSGASGSPLWTCESETGIQSAPSLGDMDGDGALDCVFVSGAKTIEAVAGDSHRLCWSFESGDAIASAPAISNREIVVGSQDGRVYALSGSDGALLWRRETGGGVRGRPGMADLNGDGVLDAVVGSDDHSVYALSGRDGAVLWSRQTEGEVRSSPAMMDLDGDGVADAVVGSNDWRVRALSGRNGSVLWSRETGGEVTAFPAIADLNGDGAPDCVVGSCDKCVYALSGKDGAVLWKVETEGKVTSSAAPWDLDGDGVSDWVVGSWDASVYALSGKSGNLLWKCKTSESVIAAPILARRKGQDEPDCVVCSWDGRVCALSGRDGVPRWSAATGAGIAAAPCAADLGDPDGVDFLIASRDGRVHALSGADGAPLWSCTVGGPLTALVVIEGPHGEGVKQVLAASEDHWIRAFEPPPRESSATTDPVTRLAALAFAQDWSALLDAAARAAQHASDACGRAAARYDQGLAWFHLNRPPDALAEFGAARRQGLRSPEGAAYEWIVATSWPECPAERRTEACAALLDGMAANPDAVFDTLILCRDSLTKEASQSLDRLLQGADVPKGTRVVAALLTIPPLPADGKRPLLPAGPERERLEAARAEIVEQIEAGKGSLTRWLAYLALIADAMSEEDHFRQIYRTYCLQPHRPPALDLLLNQRVGRGVKATLESLMDSLKALEKLLAVSGKALETAEAALKLRPDDPEARMSYAEAANDVAWRLATGEGLDPDPTTGKVATDPARAVTLAEKAVQYAREPFARDPAAKLRGDYTTAQTLAMFLDTLAAAYAARGAQGDLDRAIAAQDEALHAGPPQKDVQEMQTRLEQYRSQREKQR